jgi:DNA-binding HxlR family transcriptional regulator
MQVSSRAYGQYCGFARALELVGDRWTLMIVRDLLVEPKRFSDLERGLPGIPSNILTTRLKEMEEAGLVQRRVLPRPRSGVVYELTEVGAGLEPTVFALGRWGARLLGAPREGEIITADGLVTALRTTFQPRAAKGLVVAYELRFGDLVLHARIRNGCLNVGKGPASDSDLVIETGPVFRALLAREITPRQAIRSGSVRVRGKHELFERFVQVFRI